MNQKPTIMKKFTLLIMFVFIAGLSGSMAQVNCLDWNEYVDHKNTGGTGYYQLTVGTLEKAAQTYYYSGPGNVTEVEVLGQIPTGIGGAFSTNLVVSIYNVDANNRPTTLVSPAATKTLTWYFWETAKTVNFGFGGIAVNGNFAVSVEVQGGYNGQQFRVQYTGDGEGNLENLPSVAGSSTGGNWISLLPLKDGDLYIRPQMNSFVTSNFSASATCNVSVGQTVNFTNLTNMSTDPMFNTIALPGYTGTSTFYTWNFGDMSSSTMENPSHAYSLPGVYTVSLMASFDEWPMGGAVCSHVQYMQISVGLDVSGVGTNLTCYNDNSGAITLTAAGGDNSSYLYSLDGMAWQASATFSGLAAGTYNIYVQDGLGCVESGASVTLTEPTAIAIATPVGVTLATCGNPDGSLLAAASGGTGTLEYSLDGTTYQATGAFSSLSGGTYTVYVRDANSCVQTQSVVVGSTVAPTISLLSFTNIGCNGATDGTIAVVGSGGTGALEYSLDGVSFQSSGTFAGLGADTYHPVVKDAAGCISVLAGSGVTIVEPTAITFNLSETTTSCNGGSNGQVDVSAAIGGTGTLTYSIDGVNFQSGTNFSGLTAGNYTVTVKDAANCSSQTFITVTEPAAIVVTVGSVVNLSCFESQDGSFTVSATGGTGNFTYSVDEVNFTPAGVFNSLAAGTYTITVKDANGCTGTSGAILTEPTEITSSITTGNSTCGNANGTILAIAGAGSGSGYTYSIDGGQTSNTSGSFTGLVDSTYLVLVTDGSGCQKVFTAIISDSDGPTIAGFTSTNVTCNGGNDGSVTVTSVTGGTGTIQYSADGGQFQASNVLTGLNAGPHTIQAKDANGCTGQITVTLTEPSAFTVVLSKIDVTCFGDNSGSITVAAAGGAGSLAYSLDGVNFQGSTTFSSLPAGNYIVTVKDAGQCTETSAISIVQPSEIELSFGTLNVSCNGGSDGAINANANGGTGVITFSLDGTTYQPIGAFNNLGDGSYMLYAKDAVGCIVTEIIAINEPLEFGFTATIFDVSCTDGDNGAIDLVVGGGVPPYSYQWSNLETSEDIFNLVTGNYSVTVTDANGCSDDRSMFVDEPSNSIEITGTVTHASSAGAADGTISITVTGGIMPYTFAWSNGGVLEDISGLIPGAYLVVVEDANGCSSTASFAVSFFVGIDTDVPVAEIEINLYPNPARDAFSIELGAGQVANKATLMNLTGQVVQEVTPHSSKFEVDVKSLSEGIYFVNIYVEKGVITRKVVVSK